MKLRFLALATLLFLISCTSSTNSSEFISKAKGRYLFNADETIEIYFKETKLFAKWRGYNEIEPIKVNDSTFYIKEMNEKLVFVSYPKTHIKLAKKREHKEQEYVFTKLEKDKKTPSEYFDNNQFEIALKGYLEIQQEDSLSILIKESSINSLGYKYIRNNELNKALELFKINIALYPKSSNTYDSTADAYLRMKDTISAIEFYKKALAINPENSNSKRMLKKITE